MLSCILNFLRSICDPTWESNGTNTFSSNLWSTDASFSFLLTGRFRNKYSAISKMIPHSLGLSPSRSLQLAKYAKWSWICWNWDTVLVYTGLDKFLNGQKLAHIRLSFTRDLRNPEAFLELIRKWYRVVYTHEPGKCLHSLREKSLVTRLW